jgi:integrase
LFGLLACTGLRIREALALASSDVDLTAGVITVRAGKRGRTRLVPLHPTAMDPLRNYAAQRRRRYGPPSESAAFFRTDSSDQVSYAAAHSTFSGLRRQLGWTAIGRARAPRPHDLRHRMVVRRIQAWHADNLNVDNKGRKERVIPLWKNTATAVPLAPVIPRRRLGGSPVVPCAGVRRFPAARRATTVPGALVDAVYSISVVDKVGRIGDRSLPVNAIAHPAGIPSRRYPTARTSSSQATARPTSPGTDFIIDGGLITTL